MLNYSYPLAIGQDVLGIGIGVGMENFGLKPTWVTPDQSSSTLDPSLNYTAFSSTGLDINFGLYYKSEKRFYVGLSSTHITATDLKNKNPLGLPAQDHQIARHYYLMGGYKTELIGPGIIDGQVLVKSDGHKTSVDLNARYMISNKGYGGLTYRTSDAVALMLGYNPLPNFTIGYSYDLTLSKLSSVSRGSHEILLKYCYFLPIPPVAVSRHPRWL
jgi:type IX secretion system PorP/SprF family membrane protein